MNELFMKKYNKIKYTKLALSILIDFIGYLSYVLPGLGEFGDIIWGPMSGLFIFMLFPGKWKMAIFGTVEEVIPFLDFIPTAFITWRQVYVKENTKTLSKFLKSEMGEQAVYDDMMDDRHIDVRLK